MPQTQTTLTPLDLKLRVEKGSPLSHDEMDRNFLLLLLRPYFEDNCDNELNVMQMSNSCVSAIDTPILVDGVHSIFVDGSVFVVPVHTLNGMSLVASASYNCIILDYDLKLLKHHPYYLDSSNITLDSHSSTNDYFLIVEFSTPITENVTLTISNPA